MGGKRGIWTPEGEHLQKDIIPITQKELILLGHLHEFANKHQVVIFCKICEGNISGQNNDTTTRPSVACQCREWVFGGG